MTRRDKAFSTAIESQSAVRGKPHSEVEVLHRVGMVPRLGERDGEVGMSVVCRCVQLYRLLEGRDGT